MRNEGVPVVREGVPFLMVAAVVCFGFFLGKVWWAFLPSLMACGFLVFFFRNPERLPPIGSTMVASPADGTVISIGQATEPEFLKASMQKVSIFISMLDVHVNRVPIDGTVKNMKYRRGRFMSGSEDRAGEDNERNATLIESPKGVSVVVVQVAGTFTRRIVCYPAIGEFILKGQRLGLIKFGSRCDLYLPESSEILVKRGDKVLGGETVIAQLLEATT